MSISYSSTMSSMGCARRTWVTVHNAGHGHQCKNVCITPTVVHFQFQIHNLVNFEPKIRCRMYNLVTSATGRSPRVVCLLLDVDNSPGFKPLVLSISARRARPRSPLPDFPISKDRRFPVKLFLTSSNSPVCVPRRKLYYYKSVFTAYRFPPRRNFSCFCLQAKSESRTASSF